MAFNTLVNEGWRKVERKNGKGGGFGRWKTVVSEKKYKDEVVSSYS